MGVPDSNNIHQKNNKATASQN